MLNECIPFYRPGQDLTGKASVALTGKRLCAVSGNRTGGPGLSTDLQNVYVVGLPAAGGRVLGVVGYDVPANGLVPIKWEGVLPIKAGAAINAWQEVMTDAAGQVVPFIVAGGNQPCGVCLTGAANGADAEIRLYRAGSIA